MLRIAAIGSAALMACTIIATEMPALAIEAGICAPRAELVAAMESDGAKRRAIGFPRGQGVVELWRSEQSGAWSVLITSATGESCLTATSKDAGGVDASEDGAKAVQAAL